jgi:hypothetical protein
MNTITIWGPANIILDMDIMGTSIGVEIWTAREHGQNEETYCDAIELSIHERKLDCPGWLFNVIAESAEVERYLIAIDTARSGAE